jgi:acyl carrier protein
MIDDVLRNRIKSIILTQFLPGEREENLTDDVRLVSDGIIDSLASLKLVSLLEDEFGVIIPAHQIDEDHLNSVELIAATIESNRQPA